MAGAAAAAGVDPKAEMIRLIADIRAYGRQRNPDFVVIQQNGAALLDGHPELLNAIDGIAQEEVWYGGIATDSWNEPRGYDAAVPADLTAEYVGWLEQYRAAGKVVFNCEYALRHADAAYAMSYERGYVPYCTRRALSRLTTTPPPALAR